MLAAVGLRQFTVRAKAAVRCKVPDEAVMVTVDVVGWGVDDPPAEEPPPHPLSRPRAVRLAASSTSIGKSRRFL